MDRRQLTEPQTRMLAEIRAAGEKRYNGRARRTVEALAAAGLVEYDFELVPAAIGSWTERFTVRPSLADQEPMTHEADGTRAADPAMTEGQR